jgi:hypothetical protein
LPTRVSLTIGGKGGKTFGQAVNDAMHAIERDNPQLAGVLPKNYQIFNARLLKELLKAISTIPGTIDGDAFVAEASATANGAKMPRANWDVLEKFPVVIPKGKVAERFSALFADIIAQQQALIFQIQNLRRTRDLLLPRLLSGQVDIKEN